MTLYVDIKTISIIGGVSLIGQAIGRVVGLRLLLFNEPFLPRVRLGQHGVSLSCWDSTWRVGWNPILQLRASKDKPTEICWKGSSLFVIRCWWIWTRNQTPGTLFKIWKIHFNAPKSLSQNLLSMTQKLCWCAGCSCPVFVRHIICITIIFLCLSEFVLGEICQHDDLPTVHANANWFEKGDQQTIHAEIY